MSESFDLIQHIERKRGTWSVKGLAEIMGVSDKQLYGLVSQGRIPAIRIGGSIKFNPATTANWLRQQNTF